MQVLLVEVVCTFPDAPGHPPSPPSSAPCIPRPGPWIYANVPALYRSDPRSEEESGASEPRSGLNGFEPPCHSTGSGTLFVTNPDPEPEEGREESEPTPNRSIANSQPGGGEHGSSPCDSLFLFQDTHPENDSPTLSQFFRDRANRRLKRAAQRAQIEGVKGTPIFGRPESQAGDGRGMNQAAPHTEETPGERSTRPQFNGPFASVPLSVTGPRPWGLPHGWDDRSYLLPNYPEHQERMQRHASVRTI
ncbi:hypothetical protein HOY80DRAFT_1083886 [Tuber brumale]|nr:hypothetical protein HOY80DRAFT_1083886 [Tuber brumale]